MGFMSKFLTLSNYLMLLLIISRKLYSIKRLLYISTTVKTQFFKTFILPCQKSLQFLATVKILLNSKVENVFRLFLMRFSNLDQNIKDLINL